MADNGLSLDDELLKVAGRSSKSSKRSSQRDKDASASKRRKRAASSSSSEDYDSDDRGQKGAVMPLKKRVERDREDSEDEDEDEINRRQMEGMNEFQREMFLTEQAEKRDAISEGRKLAQTMKQREEAERARQQLKEPRGKDRSMRSSSARDTLANRQSALNELKSRRQGHKGGDLDSRLESERDRAQARARKLRAEEESGSGSESGDEEEDEEEEEGSGDESSREEEEGGDADDSSSDSSSSDDEGEDAEEDEAEAKAEDLRTLLLRRQHMEELFQLPFFSDVVTGCLVRLPHQHGRYRVWEIVDVKEDIDRKYRFKQRETAKVLVVRHGDKSSDVFLDGPSNKVPDVAALDAELEDWHARRREAGDPVLLPHVTKKVEELAKARSYNYTATDVAKLLEEKRRLASAPGNLAMEKEKWRTLAAAAAARGDDAEAERARAELARLEAEQARRASRAATNMDAINKRNMALNSRNMPMNTSVAEAGGGGQRNTLDPFSRRPTRSQIYWTTGKGNKDKEAGDKADEAGSDAEEGDGAAGKETGATGPTSPLSVDVTGASDGADGKRGGAGTPKPAMPSPRVPGLGLSTVAAAMAAAHDFELDVDLGKLVVGGGATDGGLARYRAMAARRLCVPVASMEANKRHPLTLTVTDYKRRQGLL